MNKNGLMGRWSGLKPRAKKLAAGVAMVAIATMALASLDIPGMVQRGREARFQRDAVQFLSILSGERYLWRAEADEWCVMRFDAEEPSLVEFNGDIATAADIEILSIRETPSGWRGTWRLTYYNGSTEADFAYTQSGATGLCAIESEAFPTHDRYALVLAEG